MLRCGRRRTQYKHYSSPRPVFRTDQIKTRTELYVNKLHVAWIYFYFLFTNMCDVFLSQRSNLLRTLLPDHEANICLSDLKAAKCVFPTYANKALLLISNCSDGPGDVLCLNCCICWSGPIMGPK